ncbi:MAG TPA: hypothetical protein VGL56_14070 [Fimbriimonadaceae bacterium]|jgi:hypothetical protein
METIEFGGWKRCARIVSGDVEVVVTLEVGPRIIRLGLIGQRNELHEDPDEMGKTGGDKYLSYGGHRLWIAPEDKVKTYQPENEPVEYKREGDWHSFKPAQDRFGMQKELRIKADGKGGFQLSHRISNNSSEPVTMAPWAITVMAPGGVCLIPQSTYKPFPEVLTPVKPIALWSYTNMEDPRLHWGSHLIRLKHDGGMGPTKIGTYVTQGYAGYINGSSLFVKRFCCDAVEDYPDFGCNFETFTRHDMLEFETLGLLRILKPGATAEHEEAWKLYGGVSLPDEEQALAEALEKYAGGVSIEGKES